MLPPLRVGLKAASAQGRRGALHVYADVLRGEVLAWSSLWPRAAKLHGLARRRRIDRSQ